MANAPPFAVDDGVFCDFPQKQKRHVAQPTRECLGPGAVVIEEGRAMSRRAAGGAAPGGAPYPNASHANLVGTFVEDDRWATSYQSQCAGEAERSERRRLRKAVVPAFEHNGAAARESQVEAYSAGPTGSGFFGSRPVDMRFETKDLQAGTSVSEEASHVPGYMGHGEGVRVRTAHGR